MNQKQYKEYMLSVVIRNLQQQAAFADTWPTVAKAIRDAAEEAKQELDET